LSAWIWLTAASREVAILADALKVNSTVTTILQQRYYNSDYVCFNQFCCSLAPHYSISPCGTYLSLQENQSPEQEQEKK